MPSISNNGRYYLSDIDYLKLNSTIPDFEEKILSIIYADKIEIQAKLIATLFYDIFKDYFICNINENNKEWYMFKNHRWSWVNTPIVEANIADVVKDFCLRYKKTFETEKNWLTEGKLDHLPCKPTHRELDFKLTILDGIYENFNMIARSSLRSDTFDHCAVLFHNDDFVNEHDMKPLLCFNNGVLDLITGTFRDGHPTDYCTLSCRYDYTSDLQEEKKVHLNSILEEFFPEFEMREKFLTQICYALFGKHLFKNPLDHITEYGKIHFPVFFTNQTMNGLSTTVNFIKQCFGDYAVYIPYLTSKDDLGEEGTESNIFVQCRGRKFLFITNNSDGLENEFETMALLEDLTGKFFILMKKHNLESVPDKDKLDIFSEVEWKSVFYGECEDVFKVPPTREEQVKMRIFERRCRVDNELKELKSEFISLLLQHRLKIAK